MKLKFIFNLCILLLAVDKKFPAALGFIQFV